MEKVKFSKSEVLGFLESLMLSEEATQDETDLYSDYIWTGKLYIGSTYRKLIKKMERMYDGF